ncbi:MAG TPA: CCA tRNA nucleotidyltransferase [Gemmatimonadaceae bacterium]|jgi:tRNA nucleotidyltransferase (CCA-adding enzyme)
MSLLRPPEPVLGIARRLEESGYEAWCVGGAVRDAILGHPHLDWDFATSATPEQVREVFGKRRTIPVGIQFGTVGVLDGQGTLHEVTTFRRDIKTDGRHAEVEFGATLEEDLARRDFTINAIAYSPSRDELRDPFDGRADLGRRVVRAVGDPDARMREDRLRALRAIRFAARFEFDIEGNTLAAIERSAPHMGRLSPERVKQELEKTMDQVTRPGRALARWKSTGVLATVIPLLANVGDDILAALDLLPLPTLAPKAFRLFTRVAALFVELGESRAREAMTALRFPRAEIRRVAELAETWSEIGARLGDALVERLPVSDSQLRRWVAAIGRLDLAPFMRIAAASMAARHPDDRVLQSRLRSLYRRMLRAAQTDPIEIADLAFDGDDLRVAGIPPSPLVGKILNALLEAVLEDPSRNSRDWLLQEAQRIATETSP